MKAQKQNLEPACPAFEEDLVMYYYGDGSAEDRRRVENHLGGCQKCQRFLQDLRGLLPQMARPKEMPQTFWDNYYREMKQKLATERERKSWWRTWFAPIGGWMVPAFGTAAIAALAVGLVIGKGNWNLQSQRSEEVIPQEILTDAKELEFFNSLDMLESMPKLEKEDGTKPSAQLHRNSYNA